MKAALPTAWVQDATAFESVIRSRVIPQVASGKDAFLSLSFAGKDTPVQVASADQQSLGVSVGGSTLSFSWHSWRLNDPRVYARLALVYGAPDAAFAFRLGRYCLVRSFLPESDAALHRALDLDRTFLKDPAFKAVWDALAAAKQAAAPVRPPPPLKTSERQAPPARSRTRIDPEARLLGRLGRHTFMLGIGAGPGDTVVPAFRKDGIALDLRYQYLSGGANKPNWSTWDQPPGSFVSSYAAGSARLGVIPVFTLYAMLQSKPGGGSESASDHVNCTNIDTMKAYFANLDLFFRSAAQSQQVAILHIEPDLWGYMQSTPDFRPNTPTGVAVMVKSTGRPEFAKLRDDAISFATAIRILRDRDAPAVMLAFHVSIWGAGDPAVMSRWVMKTGPWDLLIADLSDRDFGWRVYHHQPHDSAPMAEADFERFRSYYAALHQTTGLPILLWQLPYGNNVMAACNNTPGHFMDVIAPYFLDNYPANHHIAAWASAGIIGLMFGTTEGDSTFPTDEQKDGVTNPKPVPGNRGEKSLSSDDDGGFFRSRVAAYYRHPLMLEGPGAPRNKGQP